jgi:hypothetical protein
MPQTENDHLNQAVEIPVLQKPTNQELEILEKVEAMIHQQSMPVVEVVLIVKDDHNVHKGKAIDPADELLVELQCEV